MERHRRSRKHDNSVKWHHSQDYKRSRHNMPANNEEHGTSRVAARAQRKDGQRQGKAELSLAVENDHVQQWLAAIITEANEDIGKSTLRHIEAECGSRTHREQTEFRSLRHAAEFATEPGEPSKRKRRRNSYSDSSLLETAVRAKPPSTRDDGDRNTGGEASSHPYKRRKAHPQDSRSSAHSSTLRRRHEVTYEKRARHKTREDRYEPKAKGRKPSSGGQIKQTSTNTKKRISRTKAMKKTGEHLMQNFSSTSIGQDRLTIRQSHGLGLFKNGRASSPVRHRGLPDLSFSEMEFLQHSSRQALAAKEDRNTSNSREKGNRKASKVCEEISTFFQPTKTTLKEANANARARKPRAYMAGEPRAYRREKVTDQYLAGRTSSESVAFPNKKFLGFGRNSPSSERFSTARYHTTTTGHVENGPDAISRRSGEATSYVSWSETPFSSGTTTIDSELLRNANRSQVSLTPESLRRRIEDTGIFRDTGIERSLAFAPRARGIFGKDTGHHRHYSTDLQAGTANRSRFGESTTLGECFPKSSPSPSQCHSRDPNQARGQSLVMGQIRKPENIEKSLDGQSLDDRGVEKENPHSTAPNHVVKNVRDRESGCFQDKESRRPEISSPTRSLSAKASIHQSLSSGTRKKVARSARIKYKSSTLAVSEIIKEEPRGERKEEVSEKWRAQSDESFVENSTADNHLLVEGVAQGVQTARFRPTLPDATEQCPPDGDTSVEEQPFIRENIQSSNNPSIEIGEKKGATASPLLKKQKLGTVVEAPTSINYVDIGNLAPFRTDSKPLNDLPVRRSWITHGVEAAPRLTPAISLVERESSIIPQEIMEQHHLEQLSLNYPDNLANGHFGGEFGGPKSDTQRYIDEIEQEMGMDLHDDALAEDEEYVGNLLHQEVDELEMYADGHAADVEMWQARDELDLTEIERYESFGESRSIQGHHQVNNDVHSGSYVLPNGLAGQGATGYNDEINDPMQGFWQPRRQY